MDSAGAERRKRCLLIDLPLTPYAEALDLQHRLVDARSDGRLDTDAVLMLEHPPVFTLGRRGGLDDLIVSRERLVQEGIEVLPAERGGLITYHGPGQLVVYPVLDLKRSGLGVQELVAALETVMIGTAADFGVAAGRDGRNRGVWTGGKKLGSIGLAVRHGVSFHGLALNVDLDLTPFSWIHPCGLAGVAMTSLAAEGATAVSLDAARRSLAAHFALTLGFDLTPASLDALPGWPAAP
ncbi:MAG TPA: lipoyl(octanoyl) transferase [Desulfobacteraceae bacterium]|nr:MAG: lipoyl(octanoyl) transferase [Deltaproteobacteria bacterium]HDI60185.1 lipoyl(octanoyl) transferase [Desulfobacteraceae bacterium]